MPEIARYYPQIFDVPDEAAARRIILTNEGAGADTASRWASETPYTLELIQNVIALRSDMVVLDYGSGIGRLAKALIEACGCMVLGVDISADMRRLAPDYVRSKRFIPLSPGQFDTLVAAGLRVDAAIVIWVLQHCLSPVEDIARIRRSLSAEARCWVLNMPKRAIPAVRDGRTAADGFCWAIDQIDVAGLLRREFDVLAQGEPDQSRIPNMADAGAYWMSLKLPSSGAVDERSEAAQPGGCL